MTALTGLTSASFIPHRRCDVRRIRDIALVGILFLIAAPAFALTTSSNAFRIEDSSQGNVLLGAESAKIEAGEVYGTVVLLWGNLAIHGQVDEVIVLSGKVTFHPRSKLTKTLAVMGGSFESLPEAEVAPESIIYRAPGPLWTVVQSVARIWRDNITWVLQLVGLSLSILVMWAFGLLLFRFFPALQGITSGRLLSQWPQNLIIGMLGSFVVPVFMVLLVISIFGIILIPFYLLFVLSAALISYLGAALWAGHRILPPRQGEAVNPWGFLLGLIALQLFWFIGVWWGILPALFLWTLSWGGLLRGARSLWK